MSKAIITGLVTGVVISLLVLGAFYLRSFLPDTFTANLFFLVFFFTSIAAVLWVSLNYYCRSSAVKWLSLSLTGLISSFIAALLVTIFQSPLNIALYTFRDLIVILFLTSLAIAAIYWVRNRKRLPSRHYSRNQELIF